MKNWKVFSTALFGLNAICFAQVPWSVSVIPSVAIHDTSFRYSRGFLPINGSNYYELGNVTLKVGKAGRINKFLDFETRKIVESLLPMDNFPKESMDVLNMKTKHNGEKIFFDGEVTTVRFSRSVNYSNTGDFLCQYYHAKNRWTPLVQICNSSDSLFFNPFGADRDGKFYYYASSTRITQPPHIYSGNEHTVSRIRLDNLVVDTLCKIRMPDRIKNLHFQHSVISPDGKWLVLSEHWDKGYFNSDPKCAPPRAYIINTLSGEFKTCLIPSAPYGFFITPDSKYYIVGSYETGEILKVDLALAKTVQRIKGTSTIFGFFPAASGNYFLIDYDHEKCPRKVIDVRSTKDLSLITSVFLTDLFPSPNFSPYLKVIHDGRTVISTSSATDRPEGTAPDIIIHELPENINKLDKGSPLAERLKFAETIALGKLYAEKNKMMLTPPQFIKGDMASVSLSSDNHILVTGKKDVEDWTWAAYIVKLTLSGDKVWETKLPGKKISDCSEGLHFPTKDGGCIVYTMYYGHERAIGQARLSRVDGKGTIVYDYLFVPRPNPGAMYIDYNDIKMLPDGTLKLTGDKYINDKEKIRWSGRMSPTGGLSVD